MSKLMMLQNSLNSLGGRGLTDQQLRSIGVKVLATSFPCSSFIGKYKGVKVYAYHDYPSNKWHVEQA